MAPPECCASYVPPQSLTTRCMHQDPGGFCALEVGAGTGGFTRQVGGPTKPRIGCVHVCRGVKVRPQACGGNKA
jgi:hypothetical protein